MAYQSSVHITTKYSPLYVVFGFPLGLPIDCIYGTPQNALFTTQSDFVVFTMKQKQHEMRQFMRQFLDVEKVRQKNFMTAVIIDQTTKLETKC